MPNPPVPASGHVEGLERLLREKQARLANLLIERRVERDRVAALELHVQEIEEHQERLRENLRLAKQNARKERAARGRKPRRLS